MSAWFRVYNEALDDPKVQRLPGDLFKTWFNLMCVASRCEGELPPLADLAFLLRLSEEDAQARLDKLIAAGLVDREGDGIAVHNWKARQYLSDDSSARVRDHRAKKRGKPAEDVTACNGRGNVTVTAPETETESETDSPSSSGASASADAGRDPPKPEIDLAAVKPLGRDRFEAECRLVMDGLPVVVDVDFGPMRRLIEDEGLTQPDVLAGLSAAAAERSFRPVSWRQLVGWCRRAAKERIAAAHEARGPPNRSESQRIATRQTHGKSEQATLLEIANGTYRGYAGEPAEAYAGPVLDGYAVALPQRA